MAAMDYIPEKYLEVYQEVFGVPNLDTETEAKDNVNSIDAALALDGGEAETLIGAFENGPLFDGDVVSKTDRDTLMDRGYIAKVVVKGEDGFNACTHPGAWAYRILKAIEKFPAIKAEPKQTTEEV